MRDLNPEKAEARTYLILLAITIVSVIVLFLIPPIPQWMSYHQFADVA